MIVLLGGTGYIGRQFAAALEAQGWSFVAPTRAEVDYTRFGVLRDYVARLKPEFLINAAGYTGKPNVDACELNRADTLQGNALFPATVAHVCASLKQPWGHVSSGSIYSGAKVFDKGELTVRRDLDDTELLELFADHPDRFLGFTELDEPNCSFRNPSCNFYSGTKALAEEAIQDIGQSYVWRLKLPFNEREEVCNWLWQMHRQGEVKDSIHSCSHLEDCVKACLDLWEQRAPFGTYNVTNPGAFTMAHVAQEMRRILRVPVQVRTGGDDSAPPGCILDCGKLLRAGVKLRPVEEAVEDCLDRLRVSARGMRGFEAVPKTFHAEVL